MIRTRYFESAQALAEAAEALLREHLPTPGNLMLSGGRTPCAIYGRLAAAPCPVHPGRRLFLSDERMVPPDSPKNNARNLEPMLRALDCGERFIRVDTTLSAPEAARRFATDLQPLETVDLGFLGMGADGHTAGLFLPEHAAIRTAPPVLHARRPDGMEGVTLTPAFFQRVERIVLLVPGESKRAAIEALLNAPASIPAGIALADHPNTELWTDQKQR